MTNSAFQKIRSAVMKLEGGFIKNLGRVYGVYTLGFLGFVVIMAILEQAGVSAEKMINIKACDLPVPKVSVLEQ